MKYLIILLIPFCISSIEHDLSFGSGCKWGSFTLPDIPQSVEDEWSDPTYKDTGKSMNIDSYSDYSFCYPVICRFDAAYSLTLGNFEPYFKCSINLSSDSINSHNCVYSNNQSSSSYHHSEWIDGSRIYYIYASELLYSNPLEPEIGTKITLASDDRDKLYMSVGLILGLSYEKLKVNFYRGIESWNKPHWYKIDSMDYDVFNFKTGGFFSMIGDDSVCWIDGMDICLLYNKMICNNKDAGYAIEFNLNCFWRF